MDHAPTPLTHATAFSADAFIAWLNDPARTNDALFTAEHLIVHLHDSALTARGIHGYAYGPDADRRQRERFHNPAYRPTFTADHLDSIRTHGHTPRHFTVFTWKEAPLTDLAALAFFPSLTDVTCHGAFADLSPLRRLPSLTSLNLTCSLTTSLAALADHPTLATLTLTLGHPWPDLADAARLPALRKLTFNGNLPTLDGLPPLPHVQTATISAHNAYTSPPRDCTRLPELPSAHTLHLKGVFNLAGLQRYRISQLTLEGPLRDLSPLADHPTLSWLVLKSETFASIAPLATLPALEILQIEREAPFDVGPLADSASLRTIEVKNCPVIATELAAITALLPRWEDIFTIDPPRPLAPLRFFSYDCRHTEWTEAVTQRNTAHYADDTPVPLTHAAAEQHWVCREACRILTTELGRDGWRADPYPTQLDIAKVCVRYAHLSIPHGADLSRFPAAIERLRALLARLRRRWYLDLHITIAPDPSDDDPDYAPHDPLVFDETEEREAHEAWVRRVRETQARREREHRLRLLREQGAPINPAEFAAPPEPTTSDDDIEDDEDIPETPPDDTPDSAPRFRECFLTMDERTLIVHERIRSPAIYLMDQEPENWHALPLPIAARPVIPAF